MRTILKFTAILLIVAGSFSCGEEENNDNNTMKGTKWKLAGIVDVQTGKLTELEPKNCAKCYTLSFDSDTAGHGFSTSNEMMINIGNIPPTMGPMTEIAELGEGHIFVNVLYLITSYIREDNKLKFFYKKDGKESYLLFKLLVES